jgi:hypothetical protein
MCLQPGRQPCSRPNTASTRPNKPVSYSLSKDCCACHHVAPADAGRTPLRSALVSPLACSARSSGSALGPRCVPCRHFGIGCAPGPIGPMQDGRRAYCAPPLSRCSLAYAWKALTLDRKSFIDILGQGEGEIGGALLPPPEGVWGMPAERLQTLPGYSADTQKNRGEAQAGPPETRLLFG